MPWSALREPCVGPRAPDHGGKIGHAQIIPVSVYTGFSIRGARSTASIGHGAVRPRCGAAERSRPRPCSDRSVTGSGPGRRSRRGWTMSCRSACSARVLGRSGGKWRPHGPPRRSGCPGSPWWRGRAARGRAPGLFATAGGGHPEPHDQEHGRAGARALMMQLVLVAGCGRLAPACAATDEVAGAGDPPVRLLMRSRALAT